MNFMKLILYILISVIFLNPIMVQAQDESDEPEQIAFIYGEDSFPGRMLGEPNEDRQIPLQNY